MFWQLLCNYVQWQLLVTNAEALLNELVAGGSLPDETQNRIESWLCMKEEYQDCIEPDLLAIKPRRFHQRPPSPSSTSSSASSSSASSPVPMRQDTGPSRHADIKGLHVIGNKGVNKF